MLQSPASLEPQGLDLRISTKRITVLLVEDDPELASLLRTMLGNLSNPSFTAHAAPTLQEGLERLRQSPIDVVLLDLGLPDSSGIETLVGVRTAAPAVPVVVLTVVDDESVWIDALKHGAQDYLVKGQADVRLIGRVLQHAIERKRLEQTLQQNLKLEGMNAFMTKREERILELKQEVNQLLKEFGRPTKYAE